LTGFTTVKREGIDLQASFTATANAELRVWAMEETITVDWAVADCEEEVLTSPITMP
jgi:hypothetical protein